MQAMIIHIVSLVDGENKNLTIELIGRSIKAIPTIIIKNITGYKMALIDLCANFI